MYVDVFMKVRAAQSEEIAESDAKLDEILKYCEEHTKQLGLFENKNTQDYQMFVCFACGRVFDDEITMRNHVNEIHLSNKRHKYFCLNESRIKQQRKVSGASPSSSTSSIFSLFSRPKVEVLDKTCRICYKKFASRQSLVRHMGRIHPEEKVDGIKRYEV
ncbi:unnamed protein product, partial [Onchocerca flexuosa]|uniref:C2H2-type domain-containing protein n=1 Tax=Onchocerca flexuosa TaxID=387005 RepID=A0A183I7J0_9BILA